MSAVQLLQIPLRVTVSEKAGLLRTLIRLLRTAEGNIGTTWSVQEEDSMVLGIAANWKSYESYKSWTSVYEYSIVEVIIEVLASCPIYDEVVIFPEDATLALGAPVVELASWKYPVACLTEERKKKIETGFSRFKDVLSKNAHIAGDLVAGWSQSDFQQNGATARRWTSLIGWKSVGHSSFCKETKPFLDNIHWLMENNHLEPVEIFHYQFAKSA